MRPASQYIAKWAKNALYSAGIDVGLATKLAPTSGERNNGYARKGRPPARKLNFLLHALGAGLDYLIDTPVLNWWPVISMEADGTTALDITEVRGDTTVKPCFYPPRQLWIVPGHDDAGSLYIGDAGLFRTLATGATSPPKLSFAAYRETGVIACNGDLATAPDTPEIVYSNAAMTSWTTLALPGTVAVGSIAYDIVTTSTGRTIIVGAIDGDMVAWVTDDGTTWSVVEIAAVVTNLPARRIFVGKDENHENERLFVYVSSASTANGGTHLWYSDDDGDTWTQLGSGSLPNDLMIGACYLAAEQAYVFATTDGDVYRTTDPTGGAGGFTQTLNVQNCYMVAGSDGAACVAINGPEGRFVMLSVDGGVTWRKVVPEYDVVFGIENSYSLAGTEERDQFCIVSQDPAGTATATIQLSLSATGVAAR